jgi:hypothetical protein
MRQWIDIVEDRLAQQSRFHPEISSDVMDKVAKFDPTKDKRYIRWLAYLYSKNDFDFNDAPIIRNDLKIFHIAKTRNMISQEEVMKIILSNVDSEFNI